MHKTAVIVVNKQTAIEGFTLNLDCANADTILIQHRISGGTGTLSVLQCSDDTYSDGIATTRLYVVGTQAATTGARSASYCAEVPHPSRYMQLTLTSVSGTHSLYVELQQ